MKLLSALLLLLFAPVVFGQVIQESYDAGRSSVTSQERILTPANVTPATFGKLFSYQLDADVWAQPLYVPGVLINGSVHNVIYVETFGNSIYALDADQDLPVLWHINLGHPVTDKGGVPGGIGSTPYVDVSSNRMYVTVYSSENGKDVYRLHAIDIRTGFELLPSVVVAATVNGIVFDGYGQGQRPALAVANGNIIICYGTMSEGSIDYHGWVFAYDSNLTQKAVFLVTNAANYWGGIWMSGRAPAVDANGNIYIETANGTWDGVNNFGDSFLKLDSNLNLIDWFTPTAQESWDTQDEDLGSTGPTLIPGTNFLIGGDKAGILFLVNTANMGHYANTSAQSFQDGSNPQEFSGGIWNGGVFFGGKYYVWPNGYPIQAYTWNGSFFNATPLTSSFVGQPGSYSGSLAISWDGSNLSTGILWSSSISDQINNSTNYYNTCRFMAFDPTTLQVLWDSKNKTTDYPGTCSKWREPVVAHGRVYIGSLSSPDGSVKPALSVYGLIGAAAQAYSDILQPPTGVQAVLQ